jgi:two-component system, NarL family, nitrate/nitrite response regulator NarL
MRSRLTTESTVQLASLQRRRRYAILDIVALRCLIVDDNPSFLASAARLLEAQGLAVVGSATSSDEALALARSLQPDVILLDVQLGDEDGLALARQLDASLPGRPVILVSTHAEDDLAELIAESPAIGFLPKRDLGAGEIATLLSGRRET